MPTFNTTQTQYISEEKTFVQAMKFEKVSLSFFLTSSFRFVLGYAYS